MACGLSCPAACGILSLQPGIEPESPALEDELLTTRPPQKSLKRLCFKERSDKNCTQGKKFYQTNFYLFDWRPGVLDG